MHEFLQKLCVTNSMQPEARAYGDKEYHATVLVRHIHSSTALFSILLILTIIFACKPVPYH